MLISQEQKRQYSTRADKANKLVMGSRQSRDNSQILRELLQFKKLLDLNQPKTTEDQAPDKGEEPLQMQIKMN